MNLGNEYIGTNERTITANEDVKTCDEAALAREIAHENPLIPEQVAKAVLENFCKAAANLMSMGFAIQLKGGNDVALRIHPDIHVKGGNINLARAQELDPTVTELTVENAGQLVDRTRPHAARQGRVPGPLHGHAGDQGLGAAPLGGHRARQGGAHRRRRRHADTDARPHAGAGRRIS